MNGTTWLALVLVAAGLKLCWRELFNVGPAVPPRLQRHDAPRAPAAAPDPGATGGASLSILDYGIIVTSLDVELDLRNSVWPLSDIVSLVDSIERLPEAAA